MENTTQEEIYKQDMESVKKTIKAGEIYAKVNSVSKSGMSRRISFYRVNNGYIENVTGHIAWLINAVPVGTWKQGKNYLQDDGLRVSGCGMDMIYHTLSSVAPYEEMQGWNGRYRSL